MPDSSAGGFAVINGSEIVNDQRTIEYAKALGLPFTISEGCWCTNIQQLAGCESPDGYGLPSTDPAPWYDSAIPESGDFAGFLTAEFEGFGSTYTRASTEILTGGAVLGRLRPKPRTLSWRGYLFGRNCCAVLYGLRWLTATLADAGGCDGCGEADLDVLYCCPETADDIEDNCSSSVSPWVWCPGISSWAARVGPVPDGYVYPDVDSVTPDLSTLLAPLGGFGEIDLYSGPSTLDPCSFDSDFSLYTYGPSHAVGDQRWNPSEGFPTTAGTVPTGTHMYAVAGGPDYAATDPAPTWHPSSALTGVIISLDTPPPMGLVPNDDAFRTFHRVGLTEGPTILSQRKIGCGEDCRGENCQGGSCLIEVEFTLVAGNPFMHRQPLLVCEGGQFEECGEDCSERFVKVADGAECPVVPTCAEGSADCLEDLIGCPSEDIPVFPTFTDPCGCDIVVPTSFCCPISNDYPGEFFETVPIIEIYSGDLPLRNIEIRIVENPQDRDCSDLSNEPCYFCESLMVRYIPANTTLQIDGTSKRITAICPSNNAQPAESLTLSPFSWPVLKCINYCVCIITDCIQDIAANHSINIFVVPREM